MVACVSVLPSVKAISRPRRCPQLSPMRGTPSPSIVVVDILSALTGRWVRAEVVSSEGTIGRYGPGARAGIGHAVNHVVEHRKFPEGEFHKPDRTCPQRFLTKTTMRTEHLKIHSPGKCFELLTKPAQPRARRSSTSKQPSCVIIHSLQSTQEG